MIIPTTVLNDALERVSYAANRYNKHLAGRDAATAAVHVFLRGDRLGFFCTSFQIFAMETIPVELTDQDGDFDAFVFPHHILEHLKFIDGMVVLRKTAKSIMMEKQSGRQKVRIANKEEMEEFFDDPNKQFEDAKGNVPVVMDSSLLKKTLSKVEYAAHGKGIAQNVVVFRDFDSKLCIGATDAWRATVQNDIVHCAQNVETAVLSETIGIIMRMLSKTEGTVKIYFTDRGLYIKDGDFFVGALSAGQSHDIWGLFKQHPLPDTVKFELEQDLLSRALRVTSGFAESGGGYIVLEITGDDVSIYSFSRELGDSRWMMGASNLVTDEDKNIMIDPDFISQFLTRVKPKTVRFQASTPDKPVFIFGEDENLKTLCMPISVT